MNADVFSDRYAFKVQTGDMRPMFKVGMTLTVDPKRSLQPEAGVVLFTADRSSYIVRDFIGETPTQWIVRKYGESPAEEKFLREEWPIAEFIWQAA